MSEELRSCRLEVGRVGRGSNALSRMRLAPCLPQGCVENHVQYADAVCRACGTEIAAENLVEAALEAHFEVEAHVAAKDGGDPPLNVCPECGVTAYVSWNEESGCAWCETTLEECGRCGVRLTPGNVSDANSTLCSYCDYLMSKDDSHLYTWSPDHFEHMGTAPTIRPGAHYCGDSALH